MRTLLEIFKKELHDTPDTIGMNLGKILDIRSEHRDRQTELVVKDRDRIMIKAIAEGKCDKEIAVENGWAHSTAVSYRSRMLNRFGVKNSSHLIHVAHKMKLL